MIHPDASLTIYNFGPEGTEPSNQGSGSLTIYKAACPPGFNGTAYFEECFDTPLSGVEFFVGNVEAEGANRGLEGTTGPNGFVGFDVPTTGRISVVEAVPEGCVDYAVVCTDAAGQAVSVAHLGPLTPPPGVTTARFGIELDIAMGEDIRCDWYNVPAPISTATATSILNPTPTLTPSPPSGDEGWPAVIIAESCDEDDIEPVESITSLADLTTPEGEPIGRDVTSVPETSFITIDLSLDDLVAEGHAIAIESTEDEGAFVACGDVAGILTDNGDLVIALREVNDSRFADVAYLSANPDAPDQTDVSLFLVEGLAGEERDGTPAAG